MSNLRHRRSLFFFFKTSFILNVVLSLSVFVLIFYHRSYIDRLKDSITLLTVYNSSLQRDLNRSISYITNEFYSASSSFASNVWSGVKIPSLPLNLPSGGFSSSPSNVVASTPEAPVLPDLSFSGYFEINGTPYIRLRNKYYKLGDIVLGYPITAISPDVVEYRDRFYKVKEDSQ